MERTLHLPIAFYINTYIHTYIHVHIEHINKFHTHLIFNRRSIRYLCEEETRMAAVHALFHATQLLRVASRGLIYVIHNNQHPFICYVHITNYTASI